jgi:hypothetical protein
MKTAKMAALLGLAMVAGAASAQTITQGNAKFQLLTPAFGAVNGDSFYYQDANFTDWQYKYTWYWRQQNNNTNSLFSRFDSPTTFTSGNKTRLTWTNTGAGVNGFERLTGEIVITLKDGPNPRQSRVFTRATLGAHPGNAAARVFNFFHLCDMDLPGGVPNPAPDDSQNFSGNTGTFTESSSFEFAKITSDGSESRHDTNSGSVLRSLLSSGSGDLANNNGPFSNDGAFAYQWTWNLNPGETRTVRVGQGVNTEAYAVDPCSADINLDNAVDDSDFVLFAGAYNDLLCPALPAFCDADFNDDGVVDDTDFVIFAGQYNDLVCPW